MDGGGRENAAKRSRFQHAGFIFFGVSHGVRAGLRDVRLPWNGSLQALRTQAAAISARGWLQTGAR